MQQNSKKNDSYGLVYSTEKGRVCPVCEQALSSCVCGQEKEPGVQGLVRVSLSTKGRNGKPVSLVSGIALPLSELKVFAKNLRKSCSSGGTLKDGVIEIQGDHRDKLHELLLKQGYQVKRL